MPLVTMAERRDGGGDEDDAGTGTGVATRPVADIATYKQKLDGSVFRSSLIMRPVFEAASSASRRIVFAEGEDERVLRTANALLE